MASQIFQGFSLKKMSVKTCRLCLNILSYCHSELNFADWMLGNILREMLSGFCYSFIFFLLFGIIIIIPSLNTGSLNKFLTVLYLLYKI